MLRWVEWHCILWVPLVLDDTSSVEFGAGPIPTSVGLVTAGNAVYISFVSTCVSTMHVSASSASVLVCLAIADEVAPFPAFHASYGFSFLLLGSDSRVTDIHPISYDEVGGVRCGE